MKTRSRGSIACESVALTNCGAIGDPSHVIIHTCEGSYSGCVSWLRNGNAVVNIKGEGTYPADWLAKQLDYLLVAIDERTSHYGEDDWQ